MAAPETGSVFLPGTLINWVNANGGETIAMTTCPLRLDYNNWNRNPTWDKVASYRRFVYLNIRIDEENGVENSEHRENYRKIGMIKSADSSSEHPNVQVIDLHNPSLMTQVERCIIGIFAEAEEAYELEQLKTFINVVYKGPATTEEGKIVIKCKNGNYNLEKKLYHNKLYANVAMLWTIFDCPRNLPEG